MPIDIEAKAREVRTTGFCSLPGHLPRALMEECNAAFVPILAAHIDEIAQNPNRGPRRHYIALPLIPPFYDPRIFADETIVAIVERLLGADMVMAQYATDTPLSHSIYQPVHADVADLFPEEPTRYPPALIAINFPFVDITPQQGPFEVAHGTHLLPKEEALEKINAGDIALEPLLLQAGDVLIRDPRCLHRGSPNRTEIPRVVAVIGCQRAWLQRNVAPEKTPIPRAQWNGLAEDERKRLRTFEYLVTD
ncbi:MAG: phytanoyl-CoA dioxygenase family protein [Candidatus Latescibacterota bacterium]|nr:phytanoyl-CoA dioxygenase family protein [Candidatus Latescibacterota bacterium]